MYGPRCLHDCQNLGNLGNRSPHYSQNPRNNGNIMFRFVFNLFQCFYTFRTLIVVKILISILLKQIFQLKLQNLQTLSLRPLKTRLAHMLFPCFSTDFDFILGGFSNHFELFFQWFFGSWLKRPDPTKVSPLPVKSRVRAPPEASKSH